MAGTCKMSVAIGEAAQPFTSGIFDGGWSRTWTAQREVAFDADNLIAAKSIAAAASRRMA